MDATAIQFLPNISPGRRLSFSSHFPSFTHFQLHTSLSSTPSRKLLHLKAKQLRNLKPLKVSTAPGDSPSSESSERWLLEPVGDGDSKHLGFRVQMPDAFEIDSNVVTVGRVPDKADIVIPVATVSRLHARLEKKDGALLVTDLDSTNGTFIDGKKLRPGAVIPIAPGSLLTFGDVHLAMFRVSKLDNVDLPSQPDESEAKAEFDATT